VGAVAGDRLVAVLSYKTPGASDVANTAPAGWTKVAGELADCSSTSTCAHLVVATKPAAGAAESATWTFASAPAGLVIAVTAYSGVDATTPWDKTGYKVESGGSSTTTHTAPALTPSVPGSWGITAFGARASETWTPGAGMVERVDRRAATTAQATLEAADSNGPLTSGTTYSYSATESAGTSVAIGFAGNLRPASASAPTTTTTTAPTTTSAPPPTTTGPTTTVAPTTTTLPSSQHKLLVFLEENHSRAEAMTSMPHLASWASRFGQATAYNAIRNPSLPNYLAIWGGDTFGVTTTCDVGTAGCVAAAPSVWGQTIAAGLTAKAYQEDMPSNCATSDAGDYAPRHGPWPYWTDATERSWCNQFDVPLGTTTSGNLRADVDNGSLPVTGEVTPNLCNDAHDCSLGTADGWLNDWIPIVMNGPDYQAGNLTIVITFDEGTDTDNNVAFVVIDPRLSGKTVTTPVNHYSLTRWLDDNAGVSHLRKASTAVDLKAAFGL
jgi:phosphatidylinositol-3-phosphatase